MKHASEDNLLHYFRIGTATESAVPIKTNFPTRFVLSGNYNSKIESTVFECRLSKLKAVNDPVQLDRCQTKSVEMIRLARFHRFLLV